MGLMDKLKIRKAIRLHGQGKEQEAREAYEQLCQGGYVYAEYLLPYCVLLLREGGEENDRKALEILKKAEKAPDLDLRRKQELAINSAVARYKLGEMDQALALLEEAHQKIPCGLIYQTLGYLYIEAGDAEHALAYNQEALDYDDADPIVLDNLGQTYYRLLNDPAQARPYFEKAHAIKKTQIDTLYFLSRYDLEAGNRDAALEKLRQVAKGRFSPLNFVTRDQVEQEIQALERRE